MIAPAAARTAPAHVSRYRLVIVALICSAAASPASAAGQLGVTASIFSDARFRGYSLSEGRPVGILDFAYDDATGLYAAASFTGVLQRGGQPAPLAMQIGGGYAKRLRSGISLDLGITHSSYARYSSDERGSSSTEVYAGISGGGLSSRIFLSPHYFGRNAWTAYGEVNGSVSPAAHWSLEGHVGMLAALRRSADVARERTGIDWRVGVSREFGRLSLHAAWTAGAPGQDYYRDRSHSRSALVLGASWIF